MIINCPTPFPEGNQSFRIVKIDKTNSRVKVKANHVYFDTDNYMIDDKYIVDKDCNYALDYLNKIVMLKHHLQLIQMLLALILIDVLGNY